MLQRIPGNTHEQEPNVIDAFIAARLPAWLKQPSANQISSLRESLAAHQASQARLRGRALGLLPLQAFAEQEFNGLLGTSLEPGATLDKLEWVQVWPSFAGEQEGQIKRFAYTESRENALMRLMRNFEQGASFYEGTGLAPAGKAQLLSIGPAAVAAACRERDVGRRYQAELEKVYDAATMALLADDKRSGLRLASEVAALKGHISGNEQVALRELLDVGKTHTQEALKGYPGLLEVLGQPLADGLLIRLRDRDGADQGVLVYLPSDPRQTLRRFASSAALNRALADELKSADYLQFFSQLVGLEHRAAFLDTLGKRLQDDTPDLQVQGAARLGDVFAALAQQQVQRAKEDARYLLVPTADVDAAAARARHQAWKDAGLDIVNLAGLFIPVVGAVLLGSVVLQVLDEVFEGARDWSRGHQHEALEHVLGVAATLVATAATVAAVSFARSAFVEQMDWVSVDGRSSRLWVDDLAPYAEQPRGLALLDGGRFSDGQQHWIRSENRFYRVHQPEAEGVYRLRHPQRLEAYGPVVLHNGERSWQILRQPPQYRHDATHMIDSLWPQQPPLSAERVGEVLHAADVDEDELRGLLVENRRLPVNLHDTLKRFAADARIQTFFQRMAQTPPVISDQPLFDWCSAHRETTDIASILEKRAQLRGELLEHLTALAPASDPLLEQLHKAFPGLPDPYARSLASEASAMQREQAIARQRLPLEIATQARSLLRLARLNRMMAGLYLPSAYTDDTGILVMALLETLEVDELSLSLSRDVAQREPLASVSRAGGETQHWVLVYLQGRFQVFDDAGEEVALGAHETIHEALAAVLAARGLLGSLQLEGDNPASLLRDKLLAQLPADQPGIARMLGWPAQKRWLNPGQRLPDGRVGYLLSGRQPRSMATRERLRDGLRYYFPGLDDAQLEQELQLRWRRGISVEGVLRALEDDLQQLTTSLNRWVGAAIGEAAGNLRKRFAERLLRAWRGVGEAHVQGAQGQRLGLRLVFSDLPVDTLPALPLQIDFYHVRELVIREMSLTHVHADFLRAFTDLQRLDLSGNRLLRCPGGVAYLTNLRRLQLARNQIRLDAGALQALSRLPQLSHLDLSENAPLGAYDVPFQYLPHLVELRLRRCGLTAWPANIELCGSLQLVDLRDNQLQGLPPGVLGMPQAFRQGFLVSGNRLSMTEVTSLGALDPIQEVSEYESGRAWWVRDTPTRAELTAIWDALQAQADNDVLFTLLGRLEAIADFAWPERYLMQHGWNVLRLIHADTDFAASARALLQRPLADDNDVIERFSLLLREHAQAWAQREAARMSSAQLLTLGRGLFRLDRLQLFVEEDARERGLQGAMRRALGLRYRVNSRNALSLLYQPGRFRQLNMPTVSQEQLLLAQQSVQAAETPRVLAQDLARRAFWQRFLELYDPAAFAAVQQPANREALCEHLSLEILLRLEYMREGAQDG